MSQDNQDNLLIQLQDVCKIFEEEDGTQNQVLSHIQLDVRKNTFVTLLGPSGCGKTTMLRIIGGFETPTSGKVLFEGNDLAGTPPYKRPLNTVFQRYALFPHLNVAENIAFGLKIRKLPKAEIQEKVKRALHLVNMDGYDRRRISQLSGGQQQRVAIARAIVNEPKLLLLDEPLGALDLKLRQEMQLELKRMQKRLGITFIYVTHDQEEALTMSDMIVVMNDGVIQQIGTPEDIYNEPVNAFVADFIGESNIINTAVMNRDKLVTFLGRTWECADVGFGENAPVDVIIRPEDVILDQPREDKLCGEVTAIIFKGVHYEMQVSAGGFNWLVHSTSMWEPGTPVSLDVIPFNIQVMAKSPYSDLQFRRREEDEYEEV
ncbi:MAG: ABC transporter ATP-binding protein [Firmicutes bacterium]|nr:ABC transporter ATP-binding protein [Bacillota bacterium]